MKKRGKVLRDTSAGPGLLMAEGHQYAFSLEGMWRSSEPPRIGMVTDVEFDEDHGIRSITVVPESRLAKEQAEAAMAAARARGAALASGAVVRFGVPGLTAAGTLLLGWFFLPAVSVDIPLVGKAHVTFWQALAVLSSGNPLQVLAQPGGSSGVYGLLAIVALVGPFIHSVWNDKRALLGALLPLAFMVVVGLMIRSSVHGVLDVHGHAALADVAKRAAAEAATTISMGVGVYVSLLASAYFAVAGAKQFLIAAWSEHQGYDKPRKVIA